MNKAEPENKRSSRRRKSDQCVSEINGQNYPVEDWSMGGVKIFGDFKTSEMGQEIPITLKFKHQDTILNIPHVGHIVRKLNNGIALQFLPLTREVRTRFQRIIDDHNVREFAGSLT